tara:strand:+ start:294 stop:713 length:420 start_codon:yes stop_codon:yes gene_type:complete
MKPTFNIGILKIFQFTFFVNETPNSSGYRKGISKADKLEVAKIDIDPINIDKNIKNKTDLHQTLRGRKLIKVINIKHKTKLILHRGPAHIGVIKNINKIINFNLLSIILNQLLLPSTYCPNGNLLSKFINHLVLIEYYF